MIKRFLKDSIIYSLGPILTRGIQIILLPIYTRILTTSEYGTIDLLSIIGSFINIMIGLEISQGFARYYSDSRDAKEKVQYSSTSFWFIVLSYSIFLLIALSFSGYFTHVILGTAYSPVVFQVASVSIFGSGLLLYLQNQLRFYLKSKLFAAVSIIFVLVSSATTLLLLVVFKSGVTGYFLGSAFGYTAAVTLSWYFSRENYHFVFDWAKFKEMLSFSAPLIPSSIGVIILLYVDRIAIKSLMSLEYVGVFGRAYGFAALINIVLAGFQTAIAPLIYHNYKSSDTPGELAKIFRYFLSVVISFILAISIFSGEALKLFTTPAYLGAAKVIPIISFATLFMSMQAFTPGLPLAKKTKVIGLINISAAVLNTILCFTLIPIFGLTGAASSTFISAFLIFFFNMHFSQKHFYVPHKWKKIIPAFLAAMAIIAFNFSFLGFSSLSLIAKNLFKMVIWLLSSLLILHILVDVNELRNIRKQLISYIDAQVTKLKS
ncbi:MAG: lipopolysaccharide biosynthesis protein [Syntrophomonadaceae bacterium]